MLAPAEFSALDRILEQVDAVRPVYCARVVPFAMHDYQNRTRMQDAWLTLPLVRETAKGNLVDVRVHGTSAAATSIRKTLHGKRYPYADRLGDLIKYLETTKDRGLIDINMTTMAMIAGLLDINHLWVSDRVPANPARSKTGQLLDHCDRQVVKVWSGEMVYCAGQGALDYLDPAEILPRMDVRVQHMLPGTKDETILQLIAREENPRAKVEFAATWLPLVWFSKERQEQTH